MIQSIETQPSWCFVGAKVIFVGPVRLKGRTRTVQVPEMYKTYTIRDINYFDNFGVSIRLAEIRNGVVYTSSGRMEQYYVLGLFKPLVSKTIEDDIALFAPYLISTKIDEHV